MQLFPHSQQTASICIDWRVGGAVKSDVPMQTTSGSRFKLSAANSLWAVGRNWNATTDLVRKLLDDRLNDAARMLVRTTSEFTARSNGMKLNA
jgi:hypothetical protein